jgi:hypothetical protein
MVAVVGDTVEGTINVNHEAIVEVLVEVHFEVIARRSATFVRSQIASQLGTLSTSERRHITSFARVQEMSEIVRSLRPTSKAS